jgi:hypothetical protein
MQSFQIPNVQLPNVIQFPNVVQLPNVQLSNVIQLPNVQLPSVTQFPNVQLTNVIQLLNAQLANVRMYSFQMYSFQEPIGSFLCFLGSTHQQNVQDEGGAHTIRVNESP